MKHMMKLLAAVSIAVAIVFAWVQMNQRKHDAEVKALLIQGDRDTAEFNAEFTKDPAEKKMYQERAKQAQAALDKAHQTEGEAEQRTEKAGKDIDAAVDEYDRK